MKHRTTDPACVHHRPPTGWFSRWRFDRARGRSCEPCWRADERTRREYANAHRDDFDPDYAAAIEPWRPKRGLTP